MIEGRQSARSDDRRPIQTLLDGNYVGAVTTGLASSPSSSALPRSIPLVARVVVSSGAVRPGGIGVRDASGHSDAAPGDESNATPSQDLLRPRLADLRARVNSVRDRHRITLAEFRAIWTDTDEFARSCVEEAVQSEVVQESQIGPRLSWGLPAFESFFDQIVAGEVRERGFATMSQAYALALTTGRVPPRPVRVAGRGGGAGGGPVMGNDRWTAKEVFAKLLGALGLDGTKEVVQGVSDLLRGQGLATELLEALQTWWKGRSAGGAAKIMAEANLDRVWGRVLNALKNFFEGMGTDVAKKAAAALARFGIPGWAGAILVAFLVALATNLILDWFDS